MNNTTNTSFDFDNILVVEDNRFAYPMASEAIVQQFAHNILTGDFALAGEFALSRIVIKKIVSSNEEVHDEIYEIAYVDGSDTPLVVIWTDVAGFNIIKDSIIQREAILQEMRTASSSESNNTIPAITPTITQEEQSSQATQDELYYPTEDEHHEPQPVEVQRPSVSLVEEHVMSNAEMEEILQGAGVTHYHEEVHNNEDNNQSSSAPSNPFSNLSFTASFTSVNQSDGQNNEHQEITPNPDNLYIEESTVRFSGAEWFEKVQDLVIILAGIGGIGSWVSLLLARLKPKSIYMYDADKVEAVNMAGQLYQHSDIGKCKVNAMAEMIKEYSDFNSVFAIHEHYTMDSPACNIMICGFDNMDARALFYSKWLEHVKNVPNPQKKECLFIDARLSAEMCQTLCIRGDDVYNMKLYQEQYLFHDEDVEEAPCSYKQTTYCACMVAALVVNLLVNFVTNMNNPTIERDLPFFTEYNASLMYFKSQL